MSLVLHNKGKGMQRSSEQPLVGEERYVTTLKTAAKETIPTPTATKLQCPFRGARLTNIQKAWNKSMSQVSVSVEWLFGDVVNYFKFLDFKKNLKICL